MSKSVGGIFRTFFKLPSEVVADEVNLFANIVQKLTMENIL